MIWSFQVRTSGKTEFVDITPLVREVVQKSKVQEGICHVFIPHTTAGVTINENADPSVSEDMDMELKKIVPFQDRYRHLEGNAAAHIKTSLVGSSQTVFVELGELFLGTWQGVFLCEFDGPRNRNVCIKVVKTEEKG